MSKYFCLFFIQVPLQVIYLAEAFNIPIFATFSYTLRLTHLSLNYTRPVVQSAVSTFTPNAASRLSRPVMLVGFLLGLSLSVGVLIGDDAGRVNLLYLMLVYLFIPLVGAVMSVLSLVKGKGLNVARLLNTMPFLPKSWQHFMHKLRQLHMDKQWFFLQSQAAALAYATASLIVFALLLLATDINFVWRSTLLEAEQLLPLLDAIAWPWRFWEAAQPSIELLRMTEDSRLTASYSNPSSYGQWWAFILATQVLYSFALRGALLLIAKIWISNAVRKEMKKDVFYQQLQPAAAPKTSHTLSSIQHQLPSNYALSNWAGFTDKIVSQLDLAPSKTLKVGPLVSELNGPAHQGQQLLLVKAWEPPMGELQDYMESTSGMLYPINLQQNKLIQAKPMHLEEWQRFVAKIPNWGIYQPDSGATQNE